jgi:hypothetical protein
MFCKGSFKGNINKWKVREDANMAHMFSKSAMNNLPIWYKEPTYESFEFDRVNKKKEEITEAFEFDKVDRRKKAINIYDMLNDIKDIITNRDKLT